MPARAVPLQCLRTSADRSLTVPRAAQRPHDGEHPSVYEMPSGVYDMLQEVYTPQNLFI